MSHPIDAQHKKILLGVTGSVAGIKAPEIVTQLCQFAKVKVLLTHGGRNFWDKAHTYDPISWNAFLKSQEEGRVTVIDADDEWKSWNELGDPVEHIELRNWADLFLIAPLSAHTLAKLAHGLCDDTLSCVARAWKLASGSRLIVAPAMNTAMWEHPVTKEQLGRLISWGVIVVEPQSKLLACGDVGVGALASVNLIVQIARDNLH